MKQISKCLLVLLLLCPITHLFGKDTLRVGIHYAEPIAFVDHAGDVRGFCVDLFEYISEKENWNYRYVPGAWADCLERIKNGEIDILFPVLHTPERESLIDFTETALLSTWGRIFALSHDVVESVLDLNGLTIAAVRNDIFALQLRQMLDQFDLKVQFLEFDSSEEVYQSIVEKESDVGCIERFDGHLNAGRYGVVPTPVVFSPGHAKITMGKGKYAGYIDTIDSYLRMLKSDRESIYYSWYEKWFGQIEKQQWPSWLIGIFIGASCLIVLFIAFIIVLRVQVRSKTRELIKRHEQLENEVAERLQAEKRIQESLDEKVVLLKEVHHRVKNNLQIISSLLHLQSNKIRDPRFLKLFSESQDRVRSMALVHEKLYQSKDMAHIDFKDYIENLIRELVRAYNNDKIAYHVDVVCEDIDLDIDFVVPCGLIINELITNAMTHAFPDSKPDNRIRVEMKRLPQGEFELTVNDNGIGLPVDVNPTQTPSLGLRLVQILSKDQLRGSMNIVRNNGSTFQIRFSGNK